MESKRNEIKELTLDELLESEFDTEVEMEEIRENLGWGIVSNKFVIITG